MTRSRRAGVVFYLFLFISLCWSWLVVLRYFDDDEFQHTHLSWLLAHNFTPLRDFFEHHVFLYHLLLSPLMRLGDGPGLLFLWRFLSLACSVATVWAIFRFCRRQDGTVPASISTWLLFCVPMFTAKMIEARPESPAILSFTVAILLLLECDRQYLPRQKAFLTGLLSGLTVFFSAKYVYSVFGLVLVVSLFFGPVSFLFFVVGMLTSGLPLFFYLTVKNLFPEFIHAVVVNNIFWKHSFSPAGYIFEAFTTSSGLMGLAFSGILGGFFLSRSERSLLLLAPLGGTVAGIFLLPEPYRQTFLPLFPVLAIGCSFLLSHVVDSFGQAGKTFLVGLVLFSSLPGLLQILPEFSRTNRKDLQTMALVEKLDPSKGPVFDGRGLMFYRRHVGFHACMHRGIMAMIDTEKFATQTVRELCRLHYPVVIFDYRVKEMPVEIINFLNSAYQPIGESEVYMPGLSIDRSLLALEGSEIEIPVSGDYRISWVGQELAIDGKIVENNSSVFLEAGLHHFQGLGFVDRLSLVLIRRK